MASGWMTRLLDSGTEGTLALSLALGHELGIFDVIMASPQPMTSVEIAEKAKLKERQGQRDQDRAMYDLRKIFSVNKGGQGWRAPTLCEPKREVGRYTRILLQDEYVYATLCVIFLDGDTSRRVA
ncbi:hypothetical protein BaRGS_00003975, partial [Batillaria attramentaria]